MRFLGLTIAFFFLALPALARTQKDLSRFEKVSYFKLIDPAIDLSARRNIQYLKPVSLGHAKGIVREVYSRCEKDFAPPAEPFLLLSPSPEALLGFWLISYESFLPVHVPRYLKEVIAITTSSINETTYCMQAHRAVGLATHPGPEMQWALRHLSFLPPESDRLPEPARRIARWVWSTAQGAAVRPFFPEEERAEVAGVSLVFHYINRLVNVFVRHPAFWVTGRPSLKDSAFLKLAMWRVGKLAGQTRPPFDAITLAQSQGFQASADSVPSVLGTGRIASAFATWADIMRSIRFRLETEGISAMELIQIEKAIAEGKPAPLDTPATRFAVLVASHSREVSSALIDELRNTYDRSDRFIVDLASWASYLATLRIAQQM